jgi:hypothetical protein
MGVGDDDLPDGEAVLFESGHNAGDVAAGIDHDGLARDLVTEDGAVALERADDEDFVDHTSRVTGKCVRRRRILE